MPTSPMFKYLNLNDFLYCVVPFQIEVWSILHKYLVMSSFSKNLSSRHTSEKRYLVPTSSNMYNSREAIPFLSNLKPKNSIQEISQIIISGPIHNIFPFSEFLSFSHYIFPIIFKVGFTLAFTFRLSNRI